MTPQIPQTSAMSLSLSEPQFPYLHCGAPCAPNMRCREHRVTDQVVAWILVPSVLKPCPRLASQEDWPPGCSQFQLLCSVLWIGSDPHPMGLWQRSVWY